MGKKMLFFVNPNAGHAEIRSCLMEVLQIFTAGGYEVTVHTTSGPKDLTRQILARGDQYDIIVCTGGDGTLNEAVSGLMGLENRPHLGYIPGGTVNDVASTLGLSHDPIKAAQDIVHGQPYAIDIGGFGEDKWFTYVAAFGLFTDVAYETPQQDKRALGRLAYLLNGVRALSDVKSVHVRLTCQGQTVEADVLDGLVCSTTSVGGFKTTKALPIALNDGKSEIVLVRNFKNVADFSAAAGCLLRQDFQAPYFITFQASEATFAFDEPVAWTLDGEYGDTVTKVAVRNHQRALEVIVPR